MNKKSCIKLRLLILRIYLVTVSSLVIVVGLGPYSQISLAQDSSTPESEASEKCEEEIKRKEQSGGQISGRRRRELIEECIKRETPGGDDTLTPGGDDTLTPGGDDTLTPRGDDTLTIPPPATGTIEEIDFRGIEIGVLGPDDPQEQGKYIDFYQFEGREKQSVKIIFSGSNDRRDSANLSLNPVEIIVLDSNGNVISSGSTNQNKTSFISAQLPSTGTYTIAVTNKNRGDIGRYSYKLSLQGQ